MLLAYRRSASRSAAEEVAIPPQSRGSDWRFTAGSISVTGFQVTPVVGIIPANNPRRAMLPVFAVFEMPLAQALQLGRYHPLDASMSRQFVTARLSPV